MHNSKETQVREEKRTQTQTFWSGGGLPREGVGAKKFGVSFETQGYQTFGRDIPGFCPDTRGRPKSLRKKGLCSIPVPYQVDIACFLQDFRVRIACFLRHCHLGWWFWQPLVDRRTSKVYCWPTTFIIMCLSFRISIPPPPRTSEEFSV